MIKPEVIKVLYAALWASCSDMTLALFAQVSDNSDLIELSYSVWISFPEEARAKIDPSPQLTVQDGTT
jgi:hypothetical protein